MKYLSRTKVTLSEQDINLLKQNLHKARFIEEGYKYSLVFGNTTIIMFSGRDGLTFNIRINQANNIWFEIVDSEDELKALIFSKREERLDKERQYDFKQLENLFQEDME